MQAVGVAQTYAAAELAGAGADAILDDLVPLDPGMGRPDRSAPSSRGTADERPAERSRPPRAPPGCC